MCVRSTSEVSKLWLNPKQTGLQHELLISFHLINPDPDCCSMLFRLFPTSCGNFLEKKTPENPTCYCFRLQCCIIYCQQQRLLIMFSSRGDLGCRRENNWSDGSSGAASVYFDLQMWSKDIVMLSRRSWQVLQHVVLKRFPKQIQVPLKFSNDTSAAPHGGWLSPDPLGTVLPDRETSTVRVNGLLHQDCLHRSPTRICHFPTSIYSLLVETQPWEWHIKHSGDAVIWTSIQMCYSMNWGLFWT